MEKFLSHIILLQMVSKVITTESANPMHLRYALMDCHQEREYNEDDWSWENDAVKMGTKPATTNNFLREMSQQDQFFNSWQALNCPWKSQFSSKQDFGAKDKSSRFQS